MEYFLGVDLGSTTTKALVIDEHAEVLGRGITNSRSNYDVACQVALGEALTNTRFSLLSARLEQEAGSRPEELLAELELGFSEKQYRGQLSTLGKVLERIMTGLESGEKIHGSVLRILDRMEKEATDLYARGASRKSDFFRDLAGSRYLHLGEDESRDSGASYDVLVGLFDKAILEVENDPLAAGSFEHNAAFGLERMRDVPASLECAVRDIIDMELVQVSSVGTGYGRQRLPFPEAHIRSEILCHGLGAHSMFPGTRTVLDIGGQDTKAIQVDEKGIVTSFQMNDRCAAGCGRYLGYIADELNLGVHELGPLADKSSRPARINSTCTVFAGAELRERLSLGEKREDILAGLHRAIILRAMSLLARSGGISDEFTFTGGVARNPEAVKALTRLVAENYGQIQINISADSIYTGAKGAALFALSDANRKVA